MAGETYAALTPPSGSTFVAGHAARASQIERARQNFVILGKPRYVWLGGDETSLQFDTSYTRRLNSPPAVIALCEEDYRGLTVTIVFWVRVQNASGTVRMRLRNTDDGSDVAEMASAVSDTTLTPYEVTATLPAGTTPKACELQIVAGDANYGVAGFAQLRAEL